MVLKGKGRPRGDRDFRENFLRARDECRQRCRRTINRAIDQGDAKVAFKLLAVRYPERWSMNRLRKMNLAVGGRVDGAGPSRVDLVAWLRREERSGAEVRAVFDRYLATMDREESAKQET